MILFDIKKYIIIHKGKKFDGCKVIGIMYFSFIWVFLFWGWVTFLGGGGFEGFLFCLFVFLIRDMCV